MAAMVHRLEPLVVAVWVPQAVTVLPLQGVMAVLALITPLGLQQHLQVTQATIAVAVAALEQRQRVLAELAVAAGVVPLRQVQRVLTTLVAVAEQVAPQRQQVV
jgi:hypothetical protein